MSVGDKCFQSQGKSGNFIFGQGNSKEFLHKVSETSGNFIIEYGFDQQG